MKIHNSALAAKVAAQNEANQTVNTYAPMVIEALRPFVGQKVLKANGELLEKVKSKIPEMPNYGNNKDVNCYASSGRGYSITINAKTCHGHPRKDYTAAHYAEAMTWCAELSGGILTKLCNFQPLKTSWTEEEVTNARHALEKAKDEMSKAQSALGEFGTFDQ